MNAAERAGATASAAPPVEFNPLLPEFRVNPSPTYHRLQED